MRAVSLALAFVTLFAGVARADALSADELPITVANAAARSAFSRGRTLYYNLHTDGAHRSFEDAVKADPRCAMCWAYLALATRPVTAGREAVARAARLESRATKGEQLFIQALQAQVRGHVAAENDARERLVTMYPRDWRVLVARGNRLIHLGRAQEAIPYLERAVQAAPDEAAPYNDLGYAYSYAGRLDDAVRALHKYAQLLPSEPNPHDSLAELLLQAGKTQEAIAEYEKALEVDPKFVIANQGLGHARLLSGDFEGAREAYGRLADSGDTAFDRMAGLDWLAASYSHEGRIDETIRQLEQAQAAAKAAREPVWTLLFPARRALALAEVGREQEAVALAGDVARRAAHAPVSPALRVEIAARALVAKGIALARLGDLAGANKTLAQLGAKIATRHEKQDAANDPTLDALDAALAASVVVASPAEEAKKVALPAAASISDPWALALLADAAEKQGRDADANALRERALALHVVTPELGYVRPRLLAGKALAPGAHFGPMPVTTSSDAALALFTNARHLGDTYKRAVALAELEKAVELDPNFALAHLYLSIFTDSPEDGAAELAKAGALAAAGKVSDGEKLFIEAHVVAAKGDLAGKETKLRALAALYPNDWRPQAYLGEHLLRMGRKDDAIAALKEAIGRAPNEPYPDNALGYALAYEGKFDQAIAALKTYARLSPGESNPHDSLAEVDLLAGRPKDAVAEYKRSLELSPEFVPSYEGLGHARLLAGNPAGAREAYRQMSELSALPIDRVAAQTWSALTFAYDGRFAQAAGVLGRAEISASAAQDRLGVALLQARRAPLMAEAGRAKDGIELADHVLASTRGKLSPAGQAMIDRLALFGRAWSELTNHDLAAAKATAKELATVARTSEQPEAATFTTVISAWIALTEHAPRQAISLLEPADRRQPLVTAFLAKAYEQAGEAAKAKPLLDALARPTADDYELGLARATVKAP